jgi:hypothetical protein
VSFLLTPSSQPTNRPSRQPSARPSRQPTAQPLAHPTSQPTGRPTNRPTSQPTRQPSAQPTLRPTRVPSSQPSTRPSLHPSSQPTSRPSKQPTNRPTSRPSSQPTRSPSNQPSSRPITQPSCFPSAQPSQQPTRQPSRQPTSQPFGRPSSQPSSRPTGQPSRLPSSQPTRKPTGQPSSLPTSQPSTQPSTQPSFVPTTEPSGLPSSQPSSEPTSLPSSQPSARPSEQPTSNPSAFPSAQPTLVPTNQPSSLPSSQPSVYPSAQPSNQPSAQPTLQPSGFPSGQPTLRPTSQPSSFPSAQPSSVPSRQPSALPTDQPSVRPSMQPTGIPTRQPTVQPSAFPSSRPSVQPTEQPSSRPSVQPTSMPSMQPTRVPSSQPSVVPSNQPTSLPTTQPSGLPTGQPSVFPSTQPTTLPTSVPSTQPSSLPSSLPSSQPSDQPTAQPSLFPSRQPSGLPTSQPTTQPFSFPSNQPTTFPSKQPSSFPTSHPTQQPTTIPTVQPSSYPTSAPVVNIYLTKGVLFFPGDPLYSFQQQSIQATDELLGSSYILFGRKNFHQHDNKFPFLISLESTDSKAFVSLLNDNVTGISSDVVTRATTIIGDINNDGFPDLLIGFPLDSKSLIYLGTSFGTVEGRASFQLIGDPEHGGGQLGWAATRFGDLNHDGFDEIVVSAPYANIVYFIYGKQEFTDDIYVRNLLPKDGFRITGSDEDTNFGVALALVHDFNKDGFQDLAISAVRPGGANVIYLLLGNTAFGKEDIQIDEFLEKNASSCFRIIAPYLSYAGFSIAGIGDINSDGYNDLAIGSIPIVSAKYGEQRTYFIYGREIATPIDFYLSEMTAEDGFMVAGGGFLVLSAGDVNGDGMSDVMITSYDHWKGKGNAYLISYPKNVTYSPTFQPSPAPTMLLPSSAPSSFHSTFYPTSFSSFNFSTSSNDSLPRNDSSSPKPSVVPSFRPSYSSKPSVLPTPSPSRKPTSIRPAFTVKPAVTLAPTLPQLRSRNPTPIPTRASTTFNITGYTEIDCSQAGHYHGRNATNYKFIIPAISGTVQITGNDMAGAKNLFVLFCPPKDDRVDVAITNFRLSTDRISVVHLSEAGYYYPSLSEISYFSSSDGLLTLLFCTENKLQLILSSHTAFDLQERNFLFSQAGTEDKQRTNSETILAGVQIGIVGGVLVFIGLIFSALSYQDNREEKAKLQAEEKWLNSLLVVTPEEALEGMSPVADDSIGHHQPLSHRVEGNIECNQSSSSSSSSCSSSRSSSSSSTEENRGSLPEMLLPVKDISSILVDAVNQEGIEGEGEEVNEQGEIELSSINSDDWRHALSDDDKNDDNDQQNRPEHDQSVFGESTPTLMVAITLDQLETGTKQSACSSFDETDESIYFSQFSGVIAVERENLEGKRPSDDNCSSISNSEWLDDLLFSDEGEEDI